MHKIIFYLLFLSCIMSDIPMFGETGNIDGSWEGKLMINPEMGLRLVINITGSARDEALITMDSPDQGAYGIQTQIDFISSDSLNVAVPQLMVRYKGKLQGDSIKGNFSQGPLNLPLNLKPKS